jgi:tetratricopeptide (TPR) repeat protein
MAQAQEVERFVRVLDRDGEPVTDLAGGDFTVEHDGVRVDVARVELVDQPLRVALIVDDADGAVPYFRYLRDFLPEFVNALPEESEVGLVLLSGRPRLVVDFTAGRGEVLDQLERFFVETDRAAGFFAGLEETVDRWDDDLRWPVLAVVTTDGPAQRTLTDGRYQAFIERAVARGAIIHALGMFTNRAAAGGGFQTGIANDVTRLTGGWYDTVAGPTQSIREKLAEMAAEISRQYAETRYQYAVAYEPPRGADPDASTSVAVRRQQVSLSISTSGRPRAAAPAVAAAGNVGDSREELFNQGEAAFAAGDSAQAADWYQRAHDADRDWVLPLYKLGLVSLNLGDIEGAKQWFRQAVEADASSSEGQQAAAILASLP